MLNLHPLIGLSDSFGQLAYLNLPEHSLLLLIRHPMHLRFIHILLRHLPLRAVSYIKLLLHLPPSIQLLQSIQFEELPGQRFLILQSLPEIISDLKFLFFYLPILLELLVKLLIIANKVVFNHLVLYLFYYF